MQLKSLLTLLVFVTCRIQGQGFIYDQQSSTDETAFPYGYGATIQQGSPGFGQSFTPGLSSIGFIALNLLDANPANNLGAVLYVNLRSTSISGSVLSSTLPVVLTNGFSGVINFVFVGNIPSVPGATYFFEPVVQSGDLWNAISGEYDYPGGMAFAQGQAYSGSDMWFREGIVVPEPSSVTLVLIGGSLAFRVRRKPNFKP